MVDIEPVKRKKKWLNVNGHFLKQKSIEVIKVIEKKLSKKIKQNDKIKRNKRPKHVHIMTRQHVTKVTYNLDPIQFNFFCYEKKFASIFTPTSTT